MDGMGKLLDRFVGNIGPSALMVSTFFWSWFDLVPFGPVLPAAAAQNPTGLPALVLPSSLLVSAIALLFLFKAEDVRESLFRPRAFVLCSLVFGCVGTASICVGTSSDTSAPLLAGSVLVGIYQAIGILVAGSLTMCQGKTNALIHMASCLPFNIVFVLLGMFLEPGASVVLCATLPLLSSLAFKVFLVRGGNAERLASTAGKDSAGRRTSSPGRTPSRKISVYVLLLLLITAAFGLVNCRVSFFGPPGTPGELVGYAALLTRGVVAFAVFFAYVFRSRQPYSMLRAAMFLMAAGLLVLALLPAGSPALQLATCTLFYVGFAIFDLLIWAILVIVHRGGHWSVRRYVCLVMALDQFGIFVGTFFGLSVTAQAVLSLVLGVTGAALALLAAIVLSERNAVQDGLCIAVIDGVGEADPREGSAVRSSVLPSGSPVSTSTASSDPLVDSASHRGTVERLAARFFLTEKESDILDLLLHGRSVPYIAETLSVSQNTVKTHVRHIYAKLDVHNRQELLDLLGSGL